MGRPKEEKNICPAIDLHGKGSKNELSHIHSIVQKLGVTPQRKIIEIVDSARKKVIRDAEKSNAI